MGLLCIGLNHKTAPVAIREKLALSNKHLGETLEKIHDLEGIDETVVFSTCNRMEVYAVAGVISDAAENLHRYLHDHFELTSSDEDTFYQHEGGEVVRHLFGVSSGLDSMVLGETEIFGQVKKAYQTALQSNTTAKTLNRLFQKSFQVGKLVRTTTRITKGSTSVGAVAVDLSEKIFGDLKECQVMIIGAGEMARITAQSLLSRGAKSIFVSNRSHDRAVELAEEMNGTAIHFGEWISAISRVDIMITSTSAPHTFVHPDGIAAAMRRSRGRPLFVIDLAVPRDVDPEVNEIESVYLYDIDSLEAIAEEGRGRREREIAVCAGLITEEVRAWDEIDEILGSGGVVRREHGEGEDGLSDLSPTHE